MAKPKPIPKSRAEAKKQGLQTLPVSWFLPPKKKRGRPTKKKGNLKTDKIIVKDVTKKAIRFNRKQIVGKATKPRAPPKSRINWSKGEHLKTMSTAVNEWTSKTGRYYDSFGRSRSMVHFCAHAIIPYNTFQKYVRQKDSDRRAVGEGGVGRLPLVKKSIQKVIVHVLARCDRANKGKSPSEAVSLVQEVAPELSRKQASQILHRTILNNPEAQKLLKPRPLEAQVTTTKRCAITIEQQYRWHQIVENALNFLRTRNTGVCRQTGKTFGELLHHFIVVGDETSLIGNHGETKVIAARDRKKHEKILGDCRASISLYRTGNCGSGDGPTTFLMAGKNRRSGFTNKFLKAHGAKEGSTIVMTETAYMTTDAWEEATDNIISGIRAMECIRDNPQWWVLEIFDGVGSHLASLPAMEKRANNKILSLKEEGNSSHVCQVYDREVAKKDKQAKREALGIIRQYEHSDIPVLDQWVLCMSAYTFSALLS